ncbi:phosphatidylethanolamine N-methyltransferase family protein [bacterium]|nr:phosphatidylethanolamine N-methyltransferase family protein [bacterium]MBU4509456.1 phosphatidylethanolamine N-methyltransferase family protein [bacterium]
MIKKIFGYQVWHLVSVIILIAVIQKFISISYDTTNGELWGISTKAWFWIAIAIPIFHQVYVWIIWRLELYNNTFTSRYGVQRAFKIYSVGFSLLIVFRLIFIIILAISNQGSLSVNPLYTYLIAALITPVVIYLFYSVIRYFTFERAFGIDHFDKNYNRPYVKEGIFRYTNNGMYVYGILILYFPGLLLLSKAALIVALFSHIYIWIHYYCTELPDMKVIYGKTPGN